jgi:hypothetical protein
VQELADLMNASEDGSVSCKSSFQSDISTGSSVAVKLPQIGDRRSVDLAIAASRKPPRLPEAQSGGLAISHSTPSLPSVLRQGEIAAVAGDRDARNLGERLRRAIRSKDLPTTQALIAAQADIELQDRDGSNATSLAMLQGIPHSILRTLLDARANVHAVDAQGRSLPHSWAWTLPKTKNGVREAHKKLLLLAKSKADLNAQLPVTGDTPLHILAKVFNTLSARAFDGRPPDGDSHDGFGGTKDTELFANCTKSRIQLIIGSGASTSVLNGEGKTPLSLISPRFHHMLPTLFQGSAGTGVDSIDKGRLKVIDECSVVSDCLE